MKPGRLPSVAASVVCHLLLLLALLWVHPDPPRPPRVTVAVTLVADPTLPPQPAPPARTRAPPGPARPSAARTKPSPAAAKPSPAAAKPTPAKAPPRPTIPKPSPILARTDPRPAAQAQAAETAPGLSDAQIAGAAGAGSGAGGGGGGGGGGACDMAARLQTALKKDPLVQAAVAGSAGKATMIWNGDWIRSGGEDGKGLAAVREAIMWEIAFAPPACRAQPVRGLVLLSLSEGPAGTTRLAVGSGQWRWSDLLATHAAGVADTAVKR